MARYSWKKTLQPFGDAYAEMSNGIEKALRAMTDAELHQVARATQLPTQTNCYWGTYHAAPIVNDLVRVELYQRRAARESKGA